MSQKTKQCKLFFVLLKKQMKEPINQWLAFLDMERGDLLEMAEKENKTIKEAKEYYDVLTGDEELKRLADIRLYSALEENTALEAAKNDGIEQSVKDITKKMLKSKIPIKQIMEITGLKKEEINKIKKDM